MAAADEGLTLVTGATGFIGSHLARQLLDRGEQVRVLVRSERKLADVGLDDATGLDVTRGDLLDPATLPAALEGVRRLYHVAGYVSTDRRDRERVHRLNHDITVNLFEAARRAELDRTVYLASIFALGGSEDGRPVDEGVRWNLAGLGVDYVEAKRRAELYAQERCDEGMPLVFVYPCFCYGPGDVYRSSSKIIDTHLSGLLVASFAGGQNAMDVRDAAAGLIRGMDRGEVGERYLVGGTNLSYGQMGKMLARITGKRAPLLDIPPAAGRFAGRLAERLMRRPPVDEQSIILASRTWYYDDGKARRELGHRSRPIEETFIDAVEWLRRQEGARR